MAQVSKFRVGKIYWMNSVCDSDCYWYYKVIRRTEKTVVLAQVNKVGMIRNAEFKQCRINKKETERFGYESVSPLGKYSMSPVLSADNEHKIK